jgi:hypothetical protein
LEACAIAAAGAMDREAAIRFALPFGGRLLGRLKN